MNTEYDCLQLRFVNHLLNYYLLTYLLTYESVPLMHDYQTIGEEHFTGLSTNAEARSVIQESGNVQQFLSSTAEDIYY